MVEQTHKTIIDAKDSVLGRVASMAAKKLLLGENVVIVNAELAYISGRKSDIIYRYFDKLETGTIRQGPYLYRQPDRFVKRVVRGMLPHKQARGREALTRIRCYSGVPAEYASMKHETVQGANVSKLPTLRRLSVKEICEALGGKR